MSYQAIIPSMCRNGNLHWEVQDDDVCCECPTEEIDRWAITRALGKLDEPFEELGIIDVIREEI